MYTEEHRHMRSGRFGGHVSQVELKWEEAVDSYLCARGAPLLGWQSRKESWSGWMVQRKCKTSVWDSKKRERERETHTLI